MSMSHAPVCVECKVPMRVEKAGVSVVDITPSYPKGYEIWSGDKFKCPICLVEVVIGFAEKSYSRYLSSHYDESFEKCLNSIPADCRVDCNWLR